MTDHYILKGAAWYFYITPGQPDDPRAYLQASWREMGHPKVNANLIVGATQLWLVDDAPSNALRCVNMFITSLPVPVREDLGIAEMKPPHVIWETCTIVDCNKEKALILRVADTRCTPMSSLPNHCDWKRMGPIRFRLSQPGGDQYGYGPNDVGGTCQLCGAECLAFGQELHPGSIPVVSEAVMRQLALWCPACRMIFCGCCAEMSTGERGSKTVRGIIAGVGTCPRCEDGSMAFASNFQWKLIQRPAISSGVTATTPRQVSQDMILAAPGGGRSWTWAFPEGMRSGARQIGHRLAAMLAAAPNLHRFWREGRSRRSRRAKR